jgi:hypothetical protein
MMTDRVALLSYPFDKKKYNILSQGYKFAVKHPDFVLLTGQLGSP